MLNSKINKKHPKSRVFNVSNIQKKLLNKKTKEKLTECVLYEYKYNYILF